MRQLREPLDPTDLIDPRSKIDGSTPEFRETQHLFLDLPVFADTLRGPIEQRTGWRPNVRNFSLGLLDDVRARPITRDLDWGVRIPSPGTPTTRTSGSTSGSTR